MRVSAFQLFALVVLFELGSAIVVGLGMQAKQDAWIAILLGMVSGVGVFSIYWYLYLHFPSHTFTDYIPKIVGRYLGYPIAAAYISYFAYIASRILRDAGDLLITANFNETPLIVINAMILAVIVYGLVLGVDVLARSGEIFFCVVVAFIAFLLGSLFLTRHTVHPENLLPVLEQGWRPVLKTAFPLTATFPFGETIAFGALLPLFRRPAAAWKIGCAAIVASGALLSFIRALDISVLGAHLASTSQFPFLETTRRINIGEVIQRMDAFVLSILLIGSFFKIAIFTYAAAAGIRSLLSMRSASPSVLFVAACILPASLFIASNVPQHFDIGLKDVPYWLHLPFQYGIPLLLTFVLLFRRGTRGIRSTR